MAVESPFPPFDPGNRDTPDVAVRRRIPFRHIVPNVITLLSICAGMTGIRLAFEGRFEFAVLMVLGAALLDGIDGRIARLLKGQSRFGAEMDSLADIVNFGVAPGLVLYAHTLHEARSVGWIAALLYASACALRLARFNTMLDDPNRPKWHGAFFVGVPAPAGAGLALLPVYLSFSGVDLGLPEFTASMTALYIVVIGLLMASRLPTWSGKGAGIRVARDWAIPIILGVVLYVAVLVSFFWETLSLTALAYFVAIPFSVRAFSRRARREAASED
ncbi:phosphatidylcholine/phosphatidylserine synthase [Aurantimonas sp. Leaf443]|uniref:CDP-alcohol phosphatidyltransferase family protein n=1 Tax=Aurantimonas sp. Leaf443 TaxID=1736378 RepID=UPI0006FEB482|nr:phosphatidylcholine/phosphatidylserine synthase [Aurantimonas sp. Leaf443]KQT88382.1 CDP-diacylglycerol--serine O-phosphatidyltransferase [Aurantimonas sp. Leaf443]